MSHTYTHIPQPGRPRPHACGSVLRWGGVLFVVLMLLSGCTPGAALPTPTPPAALLPIIETPTPRPVGPAPTIAVRDTSLPGRMLFVVAGDLWLWQEQIGQQFTFSGDLFQPAWSPDGTQIAVVRRSASAADLALLPAQGGDLQLLTNNASTRPLEDMERIYETVWALYPAFSPDGSELAFASQYGPPFGIPPADYALSLYTMRLGENRRVQRYADAEGQVGRLVYTPDGGAVLFAYSSSVGQPPRIRRLVLSQNQTADQPGVPEQSYDPAVSPDGQWLAFAARHEVGTDVFVVPISGGVPMQISMIGSARAPAFSPDGRWLAFLAIAPGGNRFDLYVAELRAGGRLGEPRRLTENIGIDADSGIAWGR